MTEQVPPQYRSAGRADRATSGWAVGFILFAAIMMMMTVAAHGGDVRDDLA
jgi:hypothetical protein